MAMQQVLEGVLEELTAQHPELRRKRVRIIVLPDAPPPPEQSLYERLRPFLGSLRLEGSPGADKVSEVVREVVAEKLQRERADGNL